MTRRTITWNTGSLYTAEGQVITIQVRESGDLIFNDHSRGISGRMKQPISGTLEGRSDDGLKDWFLNRYLRSAYEYDETGEARQLERRDRNTPASLASYVTADDWNLSREEFLRTVRDRITEDLGDASVAEADAKVDGFPDIELDKAPFQPKEGGEPWTVTLHTDTSTGYDLVLFLDRKDTPTEDSGYMLEFGITADGKLSGMLTTHPGYDSLASLECTQNTLTVADNWGGTAYVIGDATPVPAPAAVPVPAPVPVNLQLLASLTLLTHVARHALDGVSERHVEPLKGAVANARAAIIAAGAPTHPVPVFASSDPTAQVEHYAYLTLVETVQKVVDGARAIDDEMDDVDHDGANAQPPTGDDYNALLAEMTPLFALFPRKPEESTRWP